LGLLFTFLKMKKHAFNFIIWLLIIWVINSFVQQFAGRGFFNLSQTIVAVRVGFAILLAINRPFVK